MPERSLTVIDAELSEAVKARDSARKQIDELHALIASRITDIDLLLNERSTLTTTCPDTLAALLDESPQG